MKKTVTKAIYPLNKGLDKMSVPGAQDVAALKTAKNIIISNRGRIRKAPGRVKIPYAGNNSGLQAAIHFFATSGNAQRSEIVRVIKGRVEAIRNGIAYDLGLQVSPTDSVVFEKFGNVLIIHFENTQPYYYTIGSSSLTALGILTSHMTSPPSFSRVHDSRLWYGGRPANPHVAWASAIDNYNQFSLLYGGFAMGIRSGDGDPVGLTGYSPTFRGRLFAFKLTSIYSIYRGAAGYGVDDFSNDVGCVHHNTIVLTPNDVFFVSAFGIHSLTSTEKYGGAEEATITYPIFEYFQNRVNWSDTKHMMATFDKSNNCFLLSFTSSSGTTPDTVLGFNILTKEFFEWEQCYYPVIGRYFEAGRQRTFVGDNEMGLGVLRNDYNTDFDRAIDFDVEIGPIFPMANPTQVVNFTQMWLLVKPTDKSVEIEVIYYVNGVEVGTITFDSAEDTDVPIGDDETIIGDVNIGHVQDDMVILGADLKGEGRSISFQVKQTPPDDDPDQPCEVYGIIYQFDYEEDQVKKTSI